PPYAFADTFRYYDVHVPDLYQELLSPIPYGDIGFSYALLYDVCKMFQKYVPGSVAVRVVIALEVVKVEHQYVYHGVPGICICYFLPDFLIEVMAVCKAGQLVRTCKPELFLSHFVVSLHFEA